jgi:tripartite-type tricarboxylate transporter receptor subunit TctC
MNDLIGGHVDVFFNELALSFEQHKSGRARILAVTTDKRLAELPDIPTLIESGVPNFISDTWNAISAPPKTPAPIIAKLNAAINEVLKSPEIQAQFKRMHLQAKGGTPQDMAKIDKADTERWGAVIRAANLKVQ